MNREQEGDKYANYMITSTSHAQPRELYLPAGKWSEACSSPQVPIPPDYLIFTSIKPGGNMKTCQLTLASIMTALLLLGCSRTDREPETVPKSQVNIEKPTDLTSDIAESAEEAKEAAIEITDQAVNKAEDLAEKTETTAKEVSDEISEKTAAARVAAGETVTAAKDKAESLVENTTESGNQAVTTTGASLSVPEIITLENNKGKIVLPHKMHSATIACAQCHGDADPGPMELGQEKGHALCQGCHKEKGAGPTTCSGCHEKKAIKAVEGC
jgi:hypothetical protein